jgi:hypothetical protein
MVQPLAYTNIIVKSKDLTPFSHKRGHNIGQDEMSTWLQGKIEVFQNVQLRAAKYTGVVIESHRLVQYQCRQKQ